MVSHGNVYRDKQANNSIFSSPCRHISDHHFWRFSVGQSWQQILVLHSLILDNMVRSQQPLFNNIVGCNCAMSPSDRQHMTKTLMEYGPHHQAVLAELESHLYRRQRVTQTERATDAERTARNRRVWLSSYHWTLQWNPWRFPQTLLVPVFSMFISQSSATSIEFCQNSSLFCRRKGVERLNMHRFHCTLVGGFLPSPFLWRRLLNVIYEYVA